MPKAGQVRPGDADAGRCHGGIDAQRRLARRPTSDMPSEGKIEVVEEKLRVGKRNAEQGRVRVRSYVVETPVEEEVSLRDETVHLERTPVDRAVGAGDGLRRPHDRSDRDQPRRLSSPRRRGSPRRSASRRLSTPGPRPSATPFAAPRSRSRTSGSTATSSSKRAPRGAARFPGCSAGSRAGHEGGPGARPARNAGWPLRKADRRSSGGRARQASAQVESDAAFEPRDPEKRGPGRRMSWGLRGPVGRPLAKRSLCTGNEGPSERLGSGRRPRCRRIFRRPWHGA